MHGFGCLLDGSDDSGMGAAAADVPLQSLHNFLLAGSGIFLEKSHGADNHSGSAISALECALIKKRLLHGMQLAVSFKSFDSDDGFPRSIRDGKLAGSPRRAIEQYGACTALPFAAAIFCARQT